MQGLRLATLGGVLLLRSAADALDAGIVADVLPVLEDLAALDLEPAPGVFHVVETLAIERVFQSHIDTPATHR